MWEQAGGTEPGQPGPLLLQQAHCSQATAPALWEKNQGARGQIKVLKEGIKARKNRRGTELTKNPTKQTQWRVGTLERGAGVGSIQGISHLPYIPGP